MCLSGTTSQLKPECTQQSLALATVKKDASDFNVMPFYSQFGPDICAYLTRTVRLIGHSLKTSH